MGEGKNMPSLASAAASFTDSISRSSLARDRLSTSSSFAVVYCRRCAGYGIRNLLREEKARDDRGKREQTRRTIFGICGRELHGLHLALESCSGPPLDLKLQHCRCVGVGL